MKKEEERGGGDEVGGGEGEEKQRIWDEGETAMGNGEGGAIGDWVHSPVVLHLLSFHLVL